MTTLFDNYDTAVNAILNSIGKTIVMGVPLGIGKPIGIINALYRRASADPTIQLTIITGLTLSRPILHNELEKRLVEPILDRMLTDYEDPLYEKPRELQQLPPNIQVIEFFLAPGLYLNNNTVQQDYISSKYTSVLRDSLHYSINLYAQQVARSTNDPNLYSLSSNTDLFKDVVTHLRHEMTQRKIAIVGEVNNSLPFMYNDAIVTTESFTDVVDTKKYRALFALPHDKISIQEHLIGFYTSLLVKDDGCLEIGIGKLSNAVANALIMRHKDNATYLELARRLDVNKKFELTLCASGESTIFSKGLYASTELLGDEFMELYKQGILKKCVYDHLELQQLLNSQTITEIVTPDTIDTLLEHKIIQAELTPADFAFLKLYGIFKADVSYVDKELILQSGEKIPANFNNTAAKQQIINHCLGNHLQNGRFIHAGFFLGSNKFYDQLRGLSFDEKKQIDMTRISRTNALLWNPELAIAQRQNARFINSAMMATLGGAVVSDGLKNLREFSGIGGQFDFVTMAQNIPHGRSIINVRSTRSGNQGTESNIVWDYTNISIPRFLRDIVISEYGIADCRSKTDADTIKAMLNIADSRFQPSLLKCAKKYGKIPSDYEIPAQFQNNYPHAIEPIMKELRAKGYFKPYPFGCELTADEMAIESVLVPLKKKSKLKLVLLVIASLLTFSKQNKFSSILQRMQLEKPKTLKDFIYKKLLIYLLN